MFSALRIFRRLTRLETLMADITTALEDLDGLLAELEQDILTLRGASGGQVQAIADQLEAKIAAARSAVATAPVEPAESGDTEPPAAAPDAG